MLMGYMHTNSQFLPSKDFINLTVRDREPGLAQESMIKDVMNLICMRKIEESALIIQICTHNKLQLLFTKLPVTFPAPNSQHFNQ